MLPFPYRPLQRARSFNLQEAQNPPCAVQREIRVERLSVRLIDSELSPVFSVSAKPIRPGMASAEKQVEVPPTAPPLPFRFLGRMQEDRASAVFLAIEDRNLVVRSGDTIDEIYRVESIDGGNIEFTYLPLKQKQVLPVGERS